MSTVHNLYNFLMDSIRGYMYTQFRYTSGFQGEGRGGTDLETLMKNEV